MKKLLACLDLYKDYVQNQTCSLETITDLSFAMDNPSYSESFFKEPKARKHAFAMEALSQATNEAIKETLNAQSLLIEEALKALADSEQSPSFDSNGMMRTEDYAALPVSKIQALATIVAKTFESTKGFATDVGQLYNVALNQGADSKRKALVNEKMIEKHNLFEKLLGKEEKFYLRHNEAIQKLTEHLTTQNLNGLYDDFKILMMAMKHELYPKANALQEAYKALKEAFVGFLNTCEGEAKKALESSSTSFSIFLQNYPLMQEDYQKQLHEPYQKYLGLKDDFKTTVQTYQDKARDLLGVFKSLTFVEEETSPDDEASKTEALASKAEGEMEKFGAYIETLLRISTPSSSEEGYGVELSSLKALLQEENYVLMADTTLIMDAGNVNFLDDVKKPILLLNDTLLKIVKSLTALKENLKIVAGTLIELFTKYFWLVKEYIHILHLAFGLEVKETESVDQYFEAQYTRLIKEKKEAA